MKAAERPLRVSLAVRAERRRGVWLHVARWRGSRIATRGDVMVRSVGAPLTHPYRLRFCTDSRGRYRVAKYGPIVEPPQACLAFRACYLDRRWRGRRVSVNVERTRGTTRG